MCEALSYGSTGNDWPHELVWASNMPLAAPVSCCCLWHVGATNTMFKAEDCCVTCFVRYGLIRRGSTPMIDPLQQAMTVINN
jgi:hypothetical protein